MRRPILYLSNATSVTKTMVAAITEMEATPNPFWSSRRPERKINASNPAMRMAFVPVIEFRYFES